MTNLFQNSNKTACHVYLSLTLCMLRIYIHRGCIHKATTDARFYSHVALGPSTTCGKCMHTRFPLSRAAFDLSYLALASLCFPALEMLHAFFIHIHRSNVLGKSATMRETYSSSCTILTFGALCAVDFIFVK